MVKEDVDKDVEWSKGLIKDKKSSWDQVKAKIVLVKGQNQKPWLSTQRHPPLFLFFFFFSETIWIILLEVEF